MEKFMGWAEQVTYYKKSRQCKMFMSQQVKACCYEISFT